MSKEFHQTNWDGGLRADWEALLRLAIAEDLGTVGDLTTNSLVDAGAIGSAAVVARKSGVVAGLAAVEMTLKAFEPRLEWQAESDDGQAVAPGTRVGAIRGPVRGMLSAERIVLNLICRLSGVASLTRRYVEEVEGTKCRIYDTRKTTPGWRRLEKYAVRCGGGWNHRGGLFEAVLIKDNHLAWGATAKEVSQPSSTAAQPSPPAPTTAWCPPTNLRSVPGEGKRGYTAAEAVRISRQYVNTLPQSLIPNPQSLIIEVEVDTLSQLEEVLPAGPDIVLLDNMGPSELRAAVAIRDRVNAAVELEASGGIDLTTVRTAAESGVERISVGGADAFGCGLGFRTGLAAVTFNRVRGTDIPVCPMHSLRSGCFTLLFSHVRREKELPAGSGCCHSATRKSFLFQFRARRLTAVGGEL